jgi:anti-sigma-K factor RskA
MSSARRERHEELLADQALVGLGEGERRELEALAHEFGLGQDDSLDLAAGALDRALTDATEPLPAALMARLRSDAEHHLARSAPVPASRPRPTRLAWTGWLVAAAAAIVCVLLWRALPGVPDPAGERATLLALADTLRIDWTATELAAGAGGDVVWSQELQAGVMRLTGLARNDPQAQQYQLWIFDDEQEHPIDGGVFDVTGGEVLVPIDAKLRVHSPTLFAVTVEKPGGVVVSDQQRIVLVAQR